MSKNALYPLLFLFLLGLMACTSKTQQAQEDVQTQKTAQKTHTTDSHQQVATFQNVDVEGFKKLMQQPDVVVLDVRTPQEVAQGAIEGSININLYDPNFDAKLSELDKSKTYLVYCRSGRRSVTASNKMLEKGFTKVYNLLGGYNAWSMKNR